MKERKMHVIGKFWLRQRGCWVFLQYLLTACSTACSCVLVGFFILLPSLCTTSVLMWSQLTLLYSPKHLHNKAAVWNQPECQNMQQPLSFHISLGCRKVQRMSLPPKRERERWRAYTLVTCLKPSEEDKALQGEMLYATGEGRPPFTIVNTTISAKMLNNFYRSTAWPCLSEIAASPCREIWKTLKWNGCPNYLIHLGYFCLHGPWPGYFTTL